MNKKDVFEEDKQFDFIVNMFKFVVIPAFLSWLFFSWIGGYL